MLRVGIAGIGFMGWIHWLAYKQVLETEVVAVSCRDPKKRSGDWRDIRGNFGPPGTQVDLASVRVYERVEDLLADPSIDMIDVCLPPHLHPRVCEQALRAGKDVFCEKPLALGTAECDQLLQVSKQVQRQLLVGHVLPFFPEYRYVRQAIDQRSFGCLRGAHLKRIISDPTWLDDFYDPAKVGGPLVDLHVHDAHFLRMIFGMPSSLFSVGRTRGEVVEFCTTLFEFPDPELVVSSSCGVINQQGRPFTHGFEVYFEEATMQFELSVLPNSTEAMPLKVLTSDDQVLRPEMGSGDPLDAFVDELREVANCLANGTTSPVLCAQLARDAIALCHRQSESVRRRERVNV